MKYTDAIYGTFTIPEDIEEIIKTKEFQRLKHIQQLGMLYKLIPGAIHSRWEHCIGTYNRAKIMLDRIELNTLWIDKIPALYRSAVEVAALLHDIGHGPFSHLWEHIIKGYEHEKNALACVDSIFRSVKSFAVLTHNDGFGVELVKALILGDTTLLRQPIEANYGFIFEIVNNRQCKLDVDKWDYLQRDYHYLSGHLVSVDCEPNMDFDDVFLQARASDDGAHIEYRFQDYGKMYSLFEARFLLYTHCYRSPKNLVYCRLLCELIRHHLCDCIDGCSIAHIRASNKSAFLQLTDEKILDLIDADGKHQLMLDINNIDIYKIGNGVKCPPIGRKIRDVLKTAGSEMPYDDDIHFYGDQSLMPTIACTRGLHIREYYFRWLNQSTLPDV